MMTTTKTFLPGSISSGTLRNCDLIPRFIDCLSGCPEHEHFLHQIPNDALTDEYHGFWESIDSDFIVDELIDALSNYAPEDHYFGTQYGDGADFGFWPIESDD